MGQSRHRPQGSLGLRTKPTEQAVVLTKQSRLQNLWSLFPLCGKYWQNQRQESQSWQPAEFLAKEKMFLAEKEVIWIVSCICSACWEMNSSCKTQSRSETDCRTYCGHSSEATFVLVWGHPGFWSKGKNIYHLLFVCASLFALCKSRALGG